MVERVRQPLVQAVQPHLWVEVRVAVWWEVLTSRLVAVLA